MPKNSPIVDINQFSGDFRFTHPQGQVHPAPVKRLAHWLSEPQAIAEALKVNKTVTELNLFDNNIGDVGVQAPRSSGSPEKYAAGKEMVTCSWACSWAGFGGDFWVMP